MWGCRWARAVRLVALAGVLAGGCGDRGGRGDDEYHREVDPGLRAEHYWAVVGSGECGDGSGELVRGASRPADERCDAARLGTLATCWDGRTLVHPAAPGEARCLIVEVPRAACRDVPGGGRLWECVRTDAE